MVERGTRTWCLRKWDWTKYMSCVHVVKVEWFYALSYLQRSLGGIEPSRIAVCWISVLEDQGQSSYLQRALARLWITGWQRREEWRQWRRMWSSAPTICWGGKRGNIISHVGGVCHDGHWQGKGKKD